MHPCIYQLPFSNSAIRFDKIASIIFIFHLLHKNTRLHFELTFISRHSLNCGTAFFLCSLESELEGKIVNNEMLRKRIG